MPLVKYTANADPSEGTDSIKLKSAEDGQERVLVLGGAPLEVSNEEVSGLGGRYILEEANKDGSLKEEPKSDTQPQSSPAQSVSSQIVNPVRPSGS